MQLTMFLEMLRNPIGLTVGNLFVIDQNVILTVGNIITCKFLILSKCKPKISKRCK